MITKYQKEMDKILAIINGNSNNSNNNDIIATPNFMNEFVTKHLRIYRNTKEVGMYEDGSEMFYVLFSQKDGENDMEFSNIDALKKYIFYSGIYEIKWVSENDPFDADWIEWDINEEQELIGKIGSLSRGTIPIF